MRHSYAGVQSRVFTTARRSQPDVITPLFRRWNNADNLIRVSRQQLATAADQQEEALRAARERAARQAEADADRERAVAGERARLAADQ